MVGKRHDPQHVQNTQSIPPQTSHFVHLPIVRFQLQTAEQFIKGRQIPERSAKKTRLISQRLETTPERPTSPWVAVCRCLPQRLNLINPLPRGYKGQKKDPKASRP